MEATAASMNKELVPSGVPNPATFGSCPPTAAGILACCLAWPAAINRGTCGMPLLHHLPHAAAGLSGPADLQDLYGTSEGPVQASVLHRPAPLTCPSQIYILAAVVQPDVCRGQAMSGPSCCV
mmetsp:Transcript_24536/g.72717  ORF Transcript_24536/g.72717 Transcript_24536/m.72717 type:complete len:123 (-) Transcript_24536:239-607(-)